MVQSTLRRYWVYCFLFFSFLCATMAALPLKELFMTNPWFNAAILAVWVIGLGLVGQELWRLTTEEKLFYGRRNAQITILRPLVQLYERSPYVNRASVTQTLESCYAHSHYDFVRYVAGSLVFIGLLGTLWGLSQTIVLIADVIGHLPTQGVSETFFEALKEQLRKPLAGMGIAFSSSLFGVGGSVTLGFFVAQLERAKEAFFQKAESWGATLFKGGELTPSNTEHQGPGLERSLERWLEGVERLGRLYDVSERRQNDLCQMIVGFAEKTQSLAELMKAQHFILNKWAEEQSQTRHTLEKMVQKVQDLAFNGDETIKTYLSQLTALSHEILKNMNKENVVEIVRQELRTLGNHQRKGP
jgi:hypothetical protein